jgi:hypothetical protein
MGIMAQNLKQRNADHLESLENEKNESMQKNQIKVKE